MTIAYTIYFDDGITDNISGVCYSDKDYADIKLLYPEASFTSAKKLVS